MHREITQNTLEGEGLIHNVDRVYQKIDYCLPFEEGAVVLTNVPAIRKHMQVYSEKLYRVTMTYCKPCNEVL